jgi:hypothetical protein
MLAHSAGCREEWLGEFRAACQKLGERPAGVADAPALFALRLACGPWVVVGVSPQGRDDRGRPGALGFHGLFLSSREYRKAECNPFAISGALRTDWSAETSPTLPPGMLTIARSRIENAPTDSDALRIATALARGRRVALESAVPIDDLAHQVWSLLPRRVRTRASVATWTFGNAHRFDLLATPRLKGLVLDSSYADPLSDEVLSRPGNRQSLVAWLYRLGWRHN